MLDVCSTVNPNYWDLKEIALFLTAPNTLDAASALGVYVKCGSSDWIYRGCVHAGHPSEVMPLQVCPCMQVCMRVCGGRMWWWWLWWWCVCATMHARMWAQQEPLEAAAAASRAVPPPMFCTNTSPMDHESSPGCLGCCARVHPWPQWPLPEGGALLPPGPGVVQVGVSVEPGADIIHKEGSKLGAKHDFAKRVAEDLFRFLESFQTQHMGNHIVVPANALDRCVGVRRMRV